MNRVFSLGAGLLVLSALSACGVSPTARSTSNGLPVIATAYDTGVDSKPGLTKQTAIAYDPDGCQTWLIDDGFEGYATRRNDPVSGLPVCNKLAPGGTVIGEYQTNSIPNWFPN
ncbi:hypothetical protein [Neotabrizicola shimadae]|uniref:Lipoprotein n=1 Tax=Neotabrizicola shimadae TaxID=2807096 RepID=A0A8G1ECR2_9RHOB|nr:hypothetical protein [Neotabrizicola shimadae]QYZ68639.1 hypothetical protein JO391_12740 [Neotabrizicola shimadae]